MKRLVTTALLTAVTSLIVAETATAQIFGLPSSDTSGSYSRSSRSRSSNLFRRPPVRVRLTPLRSSSRTRYGTSRRPRTTITRPGYPARLRPTYRSSTRRTSGGYRPPVVRKTWQVYTTAFTYGDARNVVAALKRSGYGSYYRKRTIPYYPRSKTVYDVMILK